MTMGADLTVSRVSDTPKRSARVIVADDCPVYKIGRDCSYAIEQFLNGRNLRNVFDGVILSSIFSP
jgi:hypothetical protein